MSKRGRKKNNIIEIRSNLYDYTINLLSSLIPKSIESIKSSMIEREYKKEDTIEILFDKKDYKFVIIDN